jgi:flavin reductase (DIM6/NTAB) family NADH-FMN oxidoreductase RutF
MYFDLASPPRKAQPSSFCPQKFGAALGMYSTGVTLVSARPPQGDALGLTANWFNSLSLDPPLARWSLWQPAAAPRAGAAARF